MFRPVRSDDDENYLFEPIVVSNAQIELSLRDFQLRAYNYDTLLEIRMTFDKITTRIKTRVLSYYLLYFLIYICYRYFRYCHTLVVASFNINSLHS